ncbi:glycosyltransferase family 4 protein [Microbacterium gorillae]|uniref:glycosyltransferase family 4 protein n=1 Tax=Microbacterium gorillae TaxID=1231063 RepID=UPI000591712E|nr:glycosyltransferase family 1 protein [Microbacterium gorillae]
MTSLFVDDRYRGAHGIGRYAREVLPRLRPEWRALGLSGSPYSPVDAFRRLPGVGPDARVYSPGYGALVRAPRQILTIHDLIQLRSPWPGRAKFLAYYAGPVRQVVRRAGVVLTVSETSAEDIRAWVRDDRVRVVNAGNGASAAFRREGPAENADEPYVMYVGNTRHHKNLDVVIRALAQAPDVRLRAVLPAGELTVASEWADAAGVSARVDLLHDVDDERLAELYRGAAATVQPSTDEGFGLPALESIACGVPVIFWSGCASVAEIVGDRGWAVQAAHDEASWADALTVAVGARRRVRLPDGRYDWDRTAAIVSDELERARG